MAKTTLHYQTYVDICLSNVELENEQKQSVCLMYDEGPFLCNLLIIVSSVKNIAHFLGKNRMTDIHYDMEM